MCISSIQPEIQIKYIHSHGLTSLLALSDRRIVTGGSNGEICITSIDYVTMEWKCDIEIEKAHDYNVSFLLELNGLKLVSASGDYTIKIWMIHENDLQEIKILKQHTKNVYKVIPLFNELKIASCSRDCTIRIWSNMNNLYQQETILSENKEVYALIESKYNKNLLIISCNGHLSFWDVLLCLKLNIIQNIFTKRNNGLIEIENEIIAVSQANPAKIILINSKSYSIIKEIQDINYIRWNSSLSLICNNSLLYAYDGCFLQISKMNEEHTIVYKTFIDYK